MKEIFFILSILISSFLQAQETTSNIVVDQHGSGNFTSIQDALSSLSDTSETARVIFIKKGIYNEKVFISKHNIILKGEDRISTIITQDIARDEWRCDHADDWGVATINISGDDISLENLTIANDYGFKNVKSKTVTCKSGEQKVINRNGHQMALRSMHTATRLRAINCHFRSYGGDTVSPWNTQDGMFYFKNCIIEGGVDFYCPRGWAWAEDCSFYAYSGTAAVWHDGSGNPDFKTVFKNCTFDGFKGFNLARYHREAQFYFINSHFSKNMSDKDVFLVPTSNKLNWGRRVYFFNSTRDGGDFVWHRNNITSIEGASGIKEVDPDWLFKGRWKPQLLNTNEFIPSAGARLRKKSVNDSYGLPLIKEVMPATHKPNDFSVNLIPYYQAEGPSWENDKVGFRIYFDQRNAKDIFGKTTPFMILDTVGSFGDAYYHHFDPRWGMDVLKVGNSLGAGSLAMLVKDKSGNDTLIRLGGNVGETSYELVKNEMNEAIIRLHYKNWKVLNKIYQLTEEISISKGNYYYQSSVSIEGLKGGEKLVTGIVNFKSEDFQTFDARENQIFLSSGKQSENNDHLGMAVVASSLYNPTHFKTKDAGAGITNTYGIALQPINNRPVVFRFYAFWEKSDPAFRDVDNLKTILKNEAGAWKNATGIVSK